MIFRKRLPCECMLFFNDSLTSFCSHDWPLQDSITPSLRHVLTRSLLRCGTSEARTLTRHRKYNLTRPEHRTTVEWPTCGACNMSLP